MKLFELPTPIVISSEQEAKDLCDSILSNPKPWAIDTETTGKSIKNKTSAIIDRIICWSLSDGVNRYFLYDYHLKHFIPFFNSDKVEKIFHNMKYDCHCLLNQGITVAHPKYDTMVMHWLYDERRPHGLKDVAKEFFEFSTKSYSKTFPRIQADELLTPKKLKISPEEHLRKVVEYATLDALMTAHVFFELKEKLKGISWKEDKSLWEFYLTVERFFSDVLFDMERRGICINAKILEEANKTIEKELEEIRVWFNQINEGPINLNSPAQLGKLLYSKFKFPVVKKTKGGASGQVKPSTDEEALDKLQDKELSKEAKEMLNKLLYYRGLDKHKSTYIDGILNRLKLMPDNKLHTAFNQHITKTGRLSSDGPNVQNIPGEEGDKYKIRYSFCALPGKKLIISDYSQAEVRVVAELSGDTKLKKDLEGDVYRKVCSRVFNIEENQVSPQLRKIFKKIVLGTNYGLGAKALAKQIEKEIGWENTEYRDRTNKEAVCKYFIDSYFNIYTDLKTHVDMVPFIARSFPLPHVRTILGRFRRLPELLSDEYGVKSEAEREAINIGPQGGVGDIMRGAMLQVHRNERLKELGCHLLMQIHDELVLEVESENVEEAKGIIEEIMKNPLKDFNITFSVPLLVETAIDTVWRKK